MLGHRRCISLILKGHARMLFKGVVSPYVPPAIYETLSIEFFFINLFYLFIFGCIGSLLMHMALSSCGKWGLLFVAVCGLLIAVASLVAEHRL